MIAFHYGRAERVESPLCAMSAASIPMIPVNIGRGGPVKPEFLLSAPHRMPSITRARIGRFLLRVGAILIHLAERPGGSCRRSRGRKEFFGIVCSGQVGNRGPMPPSSPFRH